MDIEQEERRLRDKIFESQLNWWNGLMIFSGLIITFLSAQNRSCFAFVLIILYFIIATLSLCSIFKMRNFRKYFQRNYWKWTSEDITEKEKDKDKKWAIQKGKEIDKIEESLKYVAIGTIILTFVYILNILVNSCAA
ncbi:MAG: hypothetical protein ACKKMV_02990 [Candidatus Nealsonbacteria bacterium]